VQKNPRLRQYPNRYMQPPILLSNKILYMKISEVIYKIDSICRDSISKKQITNERDYVSSFATLIRHPFGISNDLRFTDVFCCTLDNKHEKIFGSDSVIIFEMKNGYKIGMFESKWPRYFTNPHYKWDKVKKGKSHFSCQLERQYSWKNSGICQWEQFINEKQPGQTELHFDDLGSSCVFLSDAYRYYKKNKTKIRNIGWTNKDLLSLLSSNSNALNLERIIENIISCKCGKLFTKDKKVLIQNNDKSQKSYIPIFNGDNANEIDKFLSDNGMNNYLLIKSTNEINFNN